MAWLAAANRPGILSRPGIFYKARLSHRPYYTIVIAICQPLFLIFLKKFFHM